MLLRYASGKLVLFEAIGGTGVTLTEWNDFIESKWHMGYKKIVFRKLNCKRTPEMLNEFEAFIKASLGKPYKIQTSKLCCNKKKKATPAAKAQISPATQVSSQLNVKTVAINKIGDDS